MIEWATRTQYCRRRCLGIVISSCGSLVILALMAVPAFAARSYDSQITGLTNPWGVSIDNADRAWISQPEGGGGLISEFDAYPSQTLEGTQTGEGHYGASYIRSIVIDNATGDLLVADSGPVVIDVFEEGTGPFVERFEHGFGGGYLYVAADNSGGPANGRIYVSATVPHSIQAFEANRSEHEFSDKGAEYVTGNTISGTPSGPFGQPWNIAVDSAGNIYVIDLGKNVVDEFRSSGEFVQEFTGADVPGEFGELGGMAVDPTNGNVLIVDSGHQVVDEFDSSGTFLGELQGTGPSEENLFANLHGGIGVSSGGYVYVADGGSNAVDIFTPGVVLPKVTYGAVTNQTQTGGTLNASVDLNGAGDVTACEFQYGTTTSYGSGLPCSPATPYTTNQAVSAGISGLTSETEYHYRLVLVTANGTKKAPDQTYVPHAVAALSTDPATEVARNTATLNGSYTGNGEDTHYFFEWGPSTAYGNSTPLEDAGSGSGAKSISANLVGLTVETTYHYRVVATNAVGTSYGTDRSFKTLAAVENLSTTPATNVLASGATINATYTGVGEDVHYYFEWGLDSSYGNTTSAPPGADAGAGSGEVALHFDLRELQVNTVYHYRIVASDAAGTSIGTDRTFRTLGRYEFLADVGSAGSGDGQFNHPQDVAIDNATGDIYVADTGNHRVVKLDASGNFLAAWGWGVSDGNPAAEVCTSGCQAGIFGSGAGQFTTPGFIEVDDSPGPSSGDVYVADKADSVVQKFDPAGNLITSWGTNGAIDFSSPGGLIGGITVDTTGNLYVVTDNSPYVWTVIGQDSVSRTAIPTDGSYQGGLIDTLGVPGGTGIEVSSTGGWYELQAESGNGVIYSSPNGVIYAGWTLYASGAPSPVNSGIAIDRSTDDVYVDQGGYVDQFEQDRTCGGPARNEQGCFPSDTFGEGNLTGGAGLTFNPVTHRLYAADKSSSDVAVFTPLPAPRVTTDAATNVGPTSATLAGHVDPDGPGTISDCHFEYGTTASYSLGSVPCAPAAPIGAPTAVSAPVTGLTPFQTYHYRLVAIRSDGKGFPKYGHDQTFTPSPGEPPGVGATSAPAVTATTATLSSLINPKSAPTVFHFQYGTTSSYGLETHAGTSIGSDETDHVAEEVLTGLQPATTYHFRAVAVNFNGVTNGSDQTFTTPAAPSIVATSVGGITASSALISASIHPGFRATTYHVEFGRTPAYGASTLETASIGSDNALHAVSSTITGLSEGTTYHYRVVASNAIGATEGPDGTFATATSPSAAVPIVKCKPGYKKRNRKCVKPRRKHGHHKTKHKRGGRR